MDEYLKSYAGSVLDNLKARCGTPDDLGRSVLLFCGLLKNLAGVPETVCAPAVKPSVPAPEAKPASAKAPSPVKRKR